MPKQIIYLYLRLITGVFILPYVQKTLQKGEQFLEYNNENDAEHILIFGTAASISFLANLDDWFMDGTISIAPPKFARSTDSKMVITLLG